ncbi:EAL domain-containing protein [Undibacter mobilis]|uniref:cyclic-guanylate-specific phosphodiesterase n=1 Tax=Undibacter mobilis TaxID=2292256 RepID=A0A371B2K1_9BRAD|nr:EAL domain-containing protein [Undibacter mobilis]RDV01815.1 EAL domain-containing protein [Undibacter mobilis]
MGYFARGFTRQHIVAIAVGVLVAGAPLIAFNFWLSGVIDRQGREEADVSARHAIALAERRTGEVIRTLDTLSAAGVVDCGSAALEAMQRATFDAVPIKEIAILDAGGRILCSPQQRGTAIERDVVRRILATEAIEGAPGYMLDMVHLPGGKPMVRFRRPAGSSPNAIAALVPAGMFLPHVAVHAFEQELRDELNGGLESGREADGLYAAVETRGHLILAEFGKRPAGQAARDGYTAEHRSPKYGFQVLIAVPNRLISAGGAEVRWLGLFTAGVALALLGVFATLIARRDPHNPVLEIQRALAAGEFVPYYQPIVDITTGQLRGAEVLVRWKKPDGTVVLPAAFIPLAESSGLIRAMTLDLMRRVSDEAGKAIGERPALKIAFNFASKLASDETVVKDVYGVFAKSPIKMTQVVLEITERDPIESFAATRQIIAALQSLGIRIAIDDVGTGHSGLSYMLKLGVDIIKIDKMFIDAIGTDRNSTTIIETLVDLAHNMRMDVVAEGVESFEQVMHLREIGVRSAQGYVFAPPLPGRAFLKLVDAMDGLGEQPVPAPIEAAA